MNGPSDNGNSDGATAACPPDGELAAFLRGERSQLAGHVDDCEACLDRLQRMTDSAAWLKTHPVVEPPPPELDRVMSELRGDDDGDESGEISRTFEFLSPTGATLTVEVVSLR